MSLWLSVFESHKIHYLVSFQIAIFSESKLKRDKLKDTIDNDNTFKKAIKYFFLAYLKNLAHSDIQQINFKNILI